MILAMCSVKILTEIDDFVAKWYTKFIVIITEDGLALLKHQGIELIEGTKNSFRLADEFYSHHDLTLKDL